MPPARARLLLGIALAIFVVSAGAVGWRLWPRPEVQNIASDAKPSPLETPTVTTEITPPKAPKPTDLAEPALTRVSTIIDLPGDPVLVRRSAVSAPRELKFAIPAGLAANAPKADATGFFVTSPLISAAGGFMGKYSSSGAEADAVAAQLAYNAAAMSSGGGDTGASDSDDDGGDATPANAAAQMITPDNSNQAEITVGERPQRQQSILRTIVALKISELLTSNGYDADSARSAETAFKDRFNVQTLPPGGAALVYGSLNATGGYRVDQLAIWEEHEYIGAIGLSESGVWEEAARPRAPEGLLDDAPAALPTAHFDLADGLYSAGLRNGVPEAVIREAVELLSGLADLKATLPAEATMRLLYTKDVRTKGKARARVVYVGLSGPGVSPLDCYAYESFDGAYLCFDPKGGGGGGGGGVIFKSSGAVTAAGGLLAPIKGAPITSLFGMRFHPILQILRLHGGIDFGAPVGSQVRAAADGKVEIAQEVQGFGNHIRLQHDGFETSYSHLSEIPAAIHPGVEVKQGDIIALSGNTGLSTGPHLHFEFYLNRTVSDPLPHLSPELQATAASLVNEKPPAGAPTPPSPPAHGSGGKASEAEKGEKGETGGRPSEAEKVAFPAHKALVDLALDTATH